jgi:anti-sigma-K factor RskA
MGLSDFEREVRAGRREALVAARDRLAAAIQKAPTYAVARLVSELRATLAELDALGPAVKPKTLVDELIEKRAARRAQALSELTPEEAERLRAEDERWRAAAFGRSPSQTEEGPR